MNGPPLARGSEVGGQSLVQFTILSMTGMGSDDDPDGGSVSKPVRIYTGPKRLADLKIALGKRLE